MGGSGDIMAGGSCDRAELEVYAGRDDLGVMQSAYTSHRRARHREQAKGKGSDLFHVAVLSLPCKLWRLQETNQSEDLAARGICS